MLEALVRWFNSMRSKGTPLDPLGQRGENVAARFLRDGGYRIIERNFKTRFGEVDIIARDGKTLVFVEVKTRKGSEHDPEDQVNHEKQKQITKVAEFYLTRFGLPLPPVRFDVISVLWPRNQDPIIRHIQDAFGETK